MWLLNIIHFGFTLVYTVANGIAYDYAVLLERISSDSAFFQTFQKLVVHKLPVINILCIAIKCYSDH